MGDDSHSDMSYITVHVDDDSHSDTRGKTSETAPYTVHLEPKEMELITTDSKTNSYTDTSEPCMAGRFGL